MSEDILSKGDMLKSPASFFDSFEETKHLYNEPVVHVVELDDGNNEQEGPFYMFRYKPTKDSNMVDEEDTTHLERVFIGYTPKGTLEPQVRMYSSWKTLFTEAFRNGVKDVRIHKVKDFIKGTRTPSDKKKKEQSSNKNAAKS